MYCICSKKNKRYTNQRHNVISGILLNKAAVFVLTIGAWYTTDVDFGDYEINFDNFFDESGRQQKSPGIHVYNISHGQMQEYVNDFYE